MANDRKQLRDIAFVAREIVGHLQWRGGTPTQVEGVEDHDVPALADFIAAVSPDVVIELLDAAESADERVRKAFVAGMREAMRHATLSSGPAIEERIKELEADTNAEGGK